MAYELFLRAVYKALNNEKNAAAAFFYFIADGGGCSAQAPFCIGTIRLFAGW